VGVLTAAWFSGGRRISLRQVLVRVLCFPPFQAFLAGFACKLWFIPEPALQALGIIGSMLGPLVMISVGMQLRLAGAREIGLPIGLALIFKLLLAPVVALLILLGAGIGGTFAQVVMLQAAVAPGITGAIIAAEFALDKRIPPFVVSAGTVCSVLTIPAWLILARWIFP
jgi:predicted permease